MSQRETPCRCMSWKCFDRNLFENHLGVALIQPGDSVIVANERFCDLKHNGSSIVEDDFDR